MTAACEPSTGWTYCDDRLAVCHCPCTCLDQAHCPLLAAPEPESDPA